MESMHLCKDKIKEIRCSLGNYVHDENERDIIFRELINSEFIKIFPPEEDEPRFEMILLNSNGRYGGYSRKPGNIVLNISNVIDITSDIILTASGISFSSKVLLVTASIKIWNTLWSKSKIEIGEDHAIVLHSLWKNCDHNHKIKEETGFLKTNELRQEHGIKTLTKQGYTHIIDDLYKIKSIMLENGVVWLRECVKITY